MATLSRSDRGGDTEATEPRRLLEPCGEEGLVGESRYWERMAWIEGEAGDLGEFDRLACG